jgi:hypothetical protein
MEKPISISTNGFFFECTTNYTIRGINDRCLERHWQFQDQKR